ncbi:MAG: hypothetical protein HC820_03380 [Hydrococcus sp. RM1_1_31]|nr:hypothetical protein [Hydrococcus sp. RM1_1_31]
MALQEKDIEESDYFKSLASRNRLEASKYALQAVEASQNINNLGTVKANLNAVSLIKLQNRSAYRQQAWNVLQKQPDSRAKVFLLINLAKVDRERQIQHLKNAVLSASTIGDKSRFYLFAFGAFGRNLRATSRL